MHEFLIAYDVFDSKRLPKVKKIVYGYALGGQRSALEAPLSKSHLRSLTGTLSTIIKPHDQINIIRFKGKPIMLGKAARVSFENQGIIIL